MIESASSSSKTVIVIVAWAILGFVWACSQFLVSEVLHQVYIASYSDDMEVLSDVSDVVAWPAGWIYEQAEYAVMIEAVQEYRDQPDLKDEKQQAASDMLAQYAVSKDVDLAYDFTAENNIDAEVSTLAEYTIYVGTCLIWGLLIGCGGAIITLCMIHARDENSVPVSTTSNTD